MWRDAGELGRHRRRSKLGLGDHPVAEGELHDQRGLETVLAGRTVASLPESATPAAAAEATTAPAPTSATPAAATEATAVAGKPLARSNLLYLFDL